MEESYYCRYSEKHVKGKGIPSNLWAETYHTVVYILNRSPTKAIKDKTPFEAWHNRKPTIDHLKIFFGVLLMHLFQLRTRRSLMKKGKKIFVYWL